MSYPMEAYYVMRLKNYGFAPPLFQQLFTVCQAFNDNLLGHWAFVYGDIPGYPGWVHYHGTNLKADDAALKAYLQLPDLNLMEIRNWVTDQYQAGKLRWGMTFTDLKLAQEYRNRFFSYLPDTYILSVSYSEQELVKLWQELKTNPQEYDKAIYKQMEKAILTMSPEKGKVIGYDIIQNCSNELGSLVLDSFLLQNLGQDVSSQFGVELNEYGLLRDIAKRDAIIDYMNNPESKTETRAWDWVQVKYFAP
ncbi:hypothetical protein [Adhaeribacter radiodurans]|uniref:Uncharacterized protein n=1 Tax=Adhaeribacter radiodurans TaxID=2745197 RepID=A0A7L7L8J5_9BACT|nr:hypothetical protein [Adhaeribacter radiodurans]QMU29044.1 hypothetical protein HUW48_13785 [Adhaeribacter radiodurans]